MSVTLFVASTATAASAGLGDHAVGGGDLGGTPPALGVGLLVALPGHAAGSGSQTFGADDPAAPRPVFERAVPAVSRTPGDLSNLCQTPEGPTGPQYPLGNGWVFNLDLFATADGRYLGNVGTICVPLVSPAVNGPPAVPDIPQPPTIGAIWKALGLAEPAIGASPAAHGITGLPTWVWTTSAAPVALAVTLDGFTITGTARVVEYGVFPGEGGWVVGQHAGRPHDPAYAHTYERTGTYRLGVATVWTANAVMTGPGLTAPVTIDLGTALVTNGRDYPVVSIRARLVG